MSLVNLPSSRQDGGSTVMDIVGPCLLRCPLVLFRSMPAGKDPCRIRLPSYFLGRGVSQSSATRGHGGATGAGLLGRGGGPHAVRGSLGTEMNIYSEPHCTVLGEGGQQGSLPGRGAFTRCLVPDYFTHGIVDEKTDIFAFGVFILVIISGRKPVDGSHKSLLGWVKPQSYVRCVPPTCQVWLP